MSSLLLLLFSSVPVLAAPSFAWTEKDGKVTGCTVDSGAADIARCAKALPTHAGWTGSPKNRCGLLTESDAVIYEHPLVKCIAAPGTLYAWTDVEFSKCGAFTPGKKFISRASSEKCQTPVYCDVKTGVLSEVSRESGKAVLRVIESLNDLGGPGVPGGFAATLMDSSKSGPLRKILGYGCADYLTQLYRSGGSLRTDALRAAAISVKDVPFASGVRDASFFHWSNSQALSALFKGGASAEAFEKENDYLKTKAFDGLGLWLRVFYVAEDPAASRNYGKLSVRLDLADDARVINQQGPHWLAAIKELHKKYPDFSTVCGVSEPPKGWQDYSQKPFFFIAEDSGIDLITYNDVGTRVPNSFFQVIRFDKVKTVDVR